MQTAVQAAEFQPTSTPWTEDWLAVVIGLLIFALSLGVLGGADILGWVVTTSVWTDISKALAPAAKGYAGLGGVGALIATYVALLVLMTAGAAALRIDVKRFALAFSVVFVLSYLCWIIGSQANLAVTTPADLKKFGIDWSLKLTNEGGFIVALLAGLVVGNFAPGLARWLKDAIRPEWYIKTAIVVVELVVLPFAAQAFLGHEPMVAGAWMGLAVKTDGAALASGGITEALILSNAAAQGINYQKGWILGTTATIKVFIDIFIGIWAFILAYIWTRHINVREGDKARAIEIWQRFPKFILGYVLTF